MKGTKKEKCPFCGCELTAENSVVFDGAVMCRDCLDEQTVICTDCGQRIWSEAAYDVNGIRYVNIAMMITIPVQAVAD